MTVPMLHTRKKINLRLAISDLMSAVRIRDGCLYSSYSQFITITCSYNNSDFKTLQFVDWNGVLPHIDTEVILKHFSLLIGRVLSRYSILLSQRHHQQVAFVYSTKS